MLKELDNMPSGAIGFRASGKVSSDEGRNVLSPAIEAARSGGKKLRFLYFADDGFDGYESGRIWDDAVFGSRHFSDFEKLAFVSDQAAYRRAVAMLEGLMPTALKVFRTRELDQAKAWLSK
jgi:hypothetical protein